jgi:hypothetical protein
MVGWMLSNNRENPLYEKFDRVVEILRKYDCVLSLGNGLRAGAIHDSLDRAQVQELLINCELADIGRKMGCQTMCEGPGHLPLDDIEANVKLQKRMSNDAPFYVLGPLVTGLSRTSALAYLPDGRLLTAGQAGDVAFVEVRAADAPNSATTAFEGEAEPFEKSIYDLAISGYWVVIELVTPSFCSLPQYRDTVDFWLFAAQRYRADKLDEQPVDWDKYEENWGMSTCDLYWQARRLSPGVPWYAPTHAIDFKHPLLLLLRQGIEAHESPESIG